MRRLLFTALAFTMTLFAFGQQVSVESALAKATEFKNELNENADFQPFNSIRKKLKGASKMVLAYTAAQNDEKHFYVFNNPGGGWVMVSADESIDTEILAYNYEGSFDYENAPENLKGWLNKYECEISYAIREKGVKGKKSTRIGLAKSAVAKTGFESDVEPLIKTHWDQGFPYNNMCPELGGERCLTGCVATAMAQVMRYWEWPTKGMGGHSYHDTYNAVEKCGSDLDLSSDFSAHTYDYAKMPDETTGFTTDAQRQAIAQLMYDCGVSMNMMYGTAGDGGSGAPSEMIPEVMERYFGYKMGASFSAYGGDDDDKNNWKYMVFQELVASRPVLYFGFGEPGGHQFICDGYQDSTDKFHFNWGWSGDADGYFTIGSLTPKSYNFSKKMEAAIFYLEPDKTAATHTITWKSQGATYATSLSMVGAGNYLAFPIDPKVDGYEFMGWTTASSVKSDGSDFVPVENNTPTPDADATYYAVFARKSMDIVRPYELVIRADGVEENYDTNDALYYGDYASSTDGDNMHMLVFWKPMRIKKDGDNLKWEKGNGILYNMTDLGSIKDITITKSAGNFEKFIGNAMQPTAAGKGGYFTIKNDGSADGVVSNINIKYECAQFLYSDYTLTPVGNSSAVTTTKLSDYAYSTFYSSKKKTIPSGVEVYIVTGKGAENVTATKLTGDVIPANCGVVLRSSDAKTFLFADTDETPTDDVSGNLLTGWTECTSVTGDGSVSYYALNYKTSGGDKVVGFFAPKRAENPNGTFTAQAGKAYLKIEGVSAKDLMIDFGDATGIEKLNVDDQQPAVNSIYNLAGQKVGADYKGIVIVNGKKMLNK